MAHDKYTMICIFMYARWGAVQKSTGPQGGKGSQNVNRCQSGHFNVRAHMSRSRSCSWMCCRHALPWSAPCCMIRPTAACHHPASWSLGPLLPALPVSLQFRHDPDYPTGVHMQHYLMTHAHPSSSVWLTPGLWQATQLTRAPPAASWVQTPYPGLSVLCCLQCLRHGLSTDIFLHEPHVFACSTMR